MDEQDPEVVMLGQADHRPLSQRIPDRKLAPAHAAPAVLLSTGPP